MAKYFHIMHGLRGGYMPDGEPWVAMCKTRRELKSAIQGEVDTIATEDTVGFSKRAIASFAAECWRDAQRKRVAPLPYCLPCRERSPDEKIGEVHSYNYGIFCGVATRDEYLSSVQCEQEN